LNGRLRVTREGGLSNQVNQTDYTTDINSIAGDWTAEYLLTSDGRYKVKVYSRSSYNFATAVSGGTTQTSGASITQSSSFNSLSEFFTGVDKKRRERREEKLARKEEEEENNSN